MFRQIFKTTTGTQLDTLGKLLEGQYTIANPSHAWSLPKEYGMKNRGGGEEQHQVWSSSMMRFSPI